MPQFDNVDDSIFREMEEDYRPKKKKVKYPVCFIDKRHDGDPICKDCAKEEYGKLPKGKFNGPRNCWRCEGGSESTDLDDLAAEETTFDLD